MKTTGRFDENDGLFFLPFNEGGKKRIAENQFVKEALSAPSRAHAYARITEVFAFLLSQVSQKFCKVLFYRCLCGVLMQFLTVECFCSL